ncbi:MAG TPA: ArsA family ATPase, partial [Planctomycetes bacterium]|nr:ArsA family ATPase [Planctomycetota bacterium]
MAGMYLFTGKGGAGKTTCAAAFSLALAGRGRKVLLVSLDPAHNLGDVLDLPLGPEPKEALPGLRAMEADLEKVVEEKTRRA